MKTIEVGEQFPVTTAMVKLMNQLPTSPSAGVLIRRAACPMLSISSPEVTEEALRMARTVLRSRWAQLKAEDPQGCVTQHRLRLLKRCRILFPTMSLKEAKALWEEELSWKLELPEEQGFWQADHARGVVIDVSGPLTSEELLEAALDTLARNVPAGSRFLPEKEMIVSHTGLSFDIGKLPDLYGLSASGVAAVKRVSGSLGAYLLAPNAADECLSSLDPLEVDRIREMSRVSLEFDMSLAPDVFLAILECWHNFRDNWAKEEVLLSDGSSLRARGKWLFVPDSFLLSRLMPGYVPRTAGHAKVRAFLTPLACVGGPSGEPPLSRAVDAIRPLKSQGIGRSSRSLAAIPESARQGFLLAFHENVTRAQLPHFVGSNGVAWGPEASPRAAAEPLEKGLDKEDREDATDERAALARRLKERWKRVEGYSQFPATLAPAGIASEWEPSTKALLRTILSKRTFPRDFQKVKDRARRFTSTEVVASYRSQLASLPREEYVLAAGSSKSGLLLSTWVTQAGYSQDQGHLRPGHLLQLTRDMRVLSSDLGLKWECMDLGGDDAVALLQQMHRDVKGWSKQTLKFLLPLDYRERLQSLAKPRATPARHGYWTKTTLRQALAKTGMSQKELAQRLGVSAPLVSDWVRDRKPVSELQQARLDVLFGRRTVRAKSLRDSGFKPANSVELTDPRPIS